MSDYIKAQIEVQKLMAKASKLEAAAMGMQGCPYTQDEAEYWKSWHLDMAQRHENLADDLTEEIQ